MWSEPHDGTQRELSNVTGDPAGLAVDEGLVDEAMFNYIDEAMFGLCNEQDASAELIGVSDDSTALDFQSWMLDTTNTDELLAHSDFLDLFASPERTPPRRTGRSKASADFSNIFALPIPIATEFDTRERTPPRRNNRQKMAMVEKKSIRTTSRFRGVTHHCRTGRYVIRITYFTLDSE